MTTHAPHSYVVPWTPDVDPEHPGIGTQRYLLERHTHLVQHDPTDEVQYVAAAAVYVDSAGPHIEFGPYSMSEADARMLAGSLLTLADTVGDLEAHNAENEGARQDDPAWLSTWTPARVR